MHPIAAISHWSHHLHDSMVYMRHHISEHLHSRHFWVGVAVALLIMGILTLLFVWAWNSPTIYPHNLPYVPYGI